MIKRILWLGIFLVAGSAVRAQSPAPGGAPRESGLHWRGWSDAAFAEAKRSHRFVLLDLEAVWCHWCHVMDEKTYSDPKVIALL